MGFEEKPAVGKPIPGDPEHIFASMGIYIFTARFLFEQLCIDATAAGSAHDFGRDIIPSIIESHRVFAFPFRDENRKQDAYWRNVGTLDAYYAANMDLMSVDPLLNMYDEHWPIRTYHPNSPPPKFVFAEEGPRPPRRRRWTASSAREAFFGRAGGAVDRWPNVPREQLLPRRGLDPAGRGRYRPALPRPACDHRQGSAYSARHDIGFDLEHDRARGFTVSEGGVIVIAKADGVDHFVDSEQILS